VRLHAPNEHGLPIPEEGEDLERVEDALLATLTKSGGTVLAYVLTNDGMREFVFYTSAPKAIPTAIEKSRSRIATHEVHFYVAADEDWTEYRSRLP